MYIDSFKWSLVAPKLVEMGYDREQIKEYRNNQSLAEANRRGYDLTSIPAANRANIARLMLEGEDFGTAEVPEESLTDEKIGKEQASRVLEQLENTYFGLGEEKGDPLSYGRVKGIKEQFNAAMGNNPQLWAYNSLRTTVRPKFARAMGDVGNLSYAEQRAAVKSIPTALDTPEEARRKFNQFRQVLGLEQRDYGMGTTEGEEERVSRAEPQEIAPTETGDGQLPDWMRDLNVSSLRAGALGPVGTLGHFAGPDWLKKGLSGAQITALGAGGQMLGGSAGAGALTGVGDIASQQANIQEGTQERYKPGQTATKAGGAFLLSRLLSGKGVGPKSIIRDISSKVGGKATVSKEGLESALQKAANEQALGSRTAAQAQAKQIIGEFGDDTTQAALPLRRQLSRSFGSNTPMQEASRRYLSEQVKQQAPLMKVLDPAYQATAKAGGLLKGGIRTAKELLPWYLVSRALGRGGYRGD